jgi:acyl-CoA dehydrogenase
MDVSTKEERQAIRDSVRQLCRDFPDAYWRDVDKKEEYPLAFVEALTKSGYLAALIPEEYGGAGLGITEASIVLEEINRSGGNSGACHAQMYTMGTLLRHGSEEQKRRYLPAIARGELRLQAFAVTEPNAGSETTRIETRAVRHGDHYVVNGQKIFISRVKQSDLMLLLARTTPYDELTDKTRGLSVFIVDMRDVKGKLEVQPLDMMINHHTNTVFFEDVEIPAENLIGEEGMGFRYIIDGWNAERILIAGEAVGDGRWFTERASTYARDRVVFGRPIGMNQGIQFPIAQAYAHIEAADLMRFEAAAKFDRREKCGAEANMAKYLASEAAWEAANVCLNTFGGYGFARDYDVERKFRETRLLSVAPVSNNLVLAFLGQNVLGMPKSY